MRWVLCACASGGLMTRGRARDDPSKREIAEGLLRTQMTYEKAIEIHRTTPSELSRGVLNEARRQLEAHEEIVQAMLAGEELH